MSRGLRALTACPGSAQPLVPAPTCVPRPTPGPGHLHRPRPPGGELLSPRSPGRKCPLPICDQPLITESCRRRSHSTPALPFTHICFPSPDSALLSLVKRSRGPCVFTALTAFSEAVTGGGGDTHAGQPTLLNREPLISCLRSSPGKPYGTVLHHLPFLTQAPLPPWVRTGASHTETTAAAEFRAACHPHSIHGAGRLPSLHWWGEVASALQRGGQHLNPRLHSCELSPQSNPRCYLHLRSK